MCFHHPMKRIANGMVLVLAACGGGTTTGVAAPAPPACAVSPPATPPTPHTGIAGYPPHRVTLSEAELSERHTALETRTGWEVGALSPAGFPLRLELATPGPIEATVSAERVAAVRALFDALAPELDLDTAQVRADGAYVSVETSTYVLAQQVPRADGAAGLRVELVEPPPGMPAGLVERTSDELLTAWRAQGAALVTREEPDHQCDPAPGPDRCGTPEAADGACVAASDLVYSHVTTAWCGDDARRVAILDSPACAGACTGWLATLWGGAAITCVGTCRIDSPLPALLDVVTGEALDGADCHREP